MARPVTSPPPPMPTQSKTSAKQKRPLTPMQELFVAEYLVDLNATQAAIRAGYSAKSAEYLGYQLLQKPLVRAAIEAAQAKRAKKTEITAEKVLKLLWDIATADPNELIQHRRVCCRNCYGVGHEYQWRDEAEYQRACRAVEAETPEDQAPVYPLNSGGYGFDAKLTPHAKCPKCDGEGYGSVHATDTRKLSPGALALYAGVKTTKDGLEIKMHDKMAAIDRLGRHLGLFNDKLNLGVEAENPLAVFLAGLQGTPLKPVEKEGRNTNTSSPGGGLGDDVDGGGVEPSSPSAITPRDPGSDGADG